MDYGRDAKNICSHTLVIPEHDSYEHMEAETEYCGNEFWPSCREFSVALRTVLVSVAGR